MTALTPAQQAKLRDVLGGYYGQADWLVDDVIERMAGGASNLLTDDSGVRPPEDDPEMPDDPTAQDAYHVIKQSGRPLMPSTWTDCARCEGTGLISSEATDA